MSWSQLSLIIAALAGAIFFVLLYGTGLWQALPAGVLAVAFGLEWVGVPLLSRTWRALRRQRGGGR